MKPIKDISNKIHITIRHSASRAGLQCKNGINVTVYRETGAQIFSGLKLTFRGHPDLGQTQREWAGFRNQILSRNGIS